MSERPWQWDYATPRERGEFIRQHAQSPRMGEGVLCRLFQLTPAGLAEIVKGADWQEDFAVADSPPARMR